MMTIKDWIYLGITVASYLLAIIAGVYAKDKAKINRATRAGQALDVVGKLASYAVHEADYTGMDDDKKRAFAAQVIQQGLNYIGIKNMTANVINGAIEKAVNAMHLANLADSGLSQNVDEKDILQPVDQLKAGSESEQNKDVTANVK
ncbi:hypothetical protein IMAU10149_01862 [Lactobacillus helveticus]|uniref:phage holin n=1 Tax=Lactobacillus helveticus TaxID=1587 RepID=UPI001A0543EC|nr:hypothetical protein [Lactobacillus helveticus]